MAMFWLLLVFIIHVICPQQSSANVLIKRQRHHAPGQSGAERNGETEHMMQHIHKKHRVRHKQAPQPYESHQEDVYSAVDNDVADDYFSAMMDSGDDDDSSSSDSSDGKLSDKSQLTAFGLSLMFGVLGAGRFYVGDIGLATVKLLIFLVVYCASCCGATLGGGFAYIKTLMPSSTTSSGGSVESGAAMAADAGLNVCAALTACLACCSFPAMSIWYIVDVVLFAFNYIPDANGLPLNWKTVP
eukprot:62786_1